MTKSEIFKEAHRRAYFIYDGSYIACFALALREIYNELKTSSQVELAKLTGSEKQIKWASDIRSSLLNSITILIAKFNGKSQYKVDADKIIKAIKLQNKAEWFINNRDETKIMSFIMSFAW